LLEEIGLQLIEHEIGRHDSPQRSLGQVAEGIVDDPQLGPQHATCAGGIDRPKNVFPKPPTNGEQWIIIDQNRPILSARANARAGQLPFDFPRMTVEAFANFIDVLGLLGQQHTPCDRFNVGIGQLDRNREAIPQLAELGGSPQSVLASANQ
jgi:hypothetical protein